MATAIGLRGADFFFDLLMSLAFRSNSLGFSREARAQYPHPLLADILVGIVYSLGAPVGQAPSYVLDADGIRAFPYDRHYAKARLQQLVPRIPLC